MNAKIFPAWVTRRDVVAVATLAGAGLFALSLNGCVVAEARPRARIVAEPPRVVVAEGPRTSEVGVVIRETPPPLRREVIVERERPSPAHVWVAGYWRHDGRAFVWVPGHWERPPHERAVWVAPRWERREGGYVFVEGVWR